MSKLIWRHVVINTLSSWLHGDPRGFRSRKHRIHSSGDYKNRPPEGEHAGLYRYQLARSAAPVTIPAELRPIIGKVLASTLCAEGWRVLLVSVSDTHAHALVMLPADRAMTRRVVGEAKKAASRSVRAQMPGSVWSAGGVYKPVTTVSHLREAYEYIRTRQEKGAHVLVIEGCPERL